MDDRVEPDTERNGAGHESEDEIVDALAFIRLANEVKSTRKEVGVVSEEVKVVGAKVDGLTIRFDENETQDAKQTSAIDQLQKSTNWKSVFVKTAASVAAFLAATSNPEFRSAMKFVWETLRAAFVLLLLVTVGVSSSGCAHASKGLELFGEVLTSGQHLAEKSCEFSHDPEQYQRCVHEVQAKFAGSKLAYQQARTAEAALSYLCNHLDLAPPELIPALDLVCKQ